MSRARVFIGLRSSGGAIAQGEDGYTDDGQYYNFDAITERVFPAGVGGEAIFDVAYVLVTYSARFRLYVAAIIDGVQYAESLLDPLVAPAAEKTSRFEVPLRTEVKNALGTTVGKRALRGGWAQFRIRSAFDATYPPGAVRVDEVRVEGEVMVESLTPLSATGA